MLRRPARSTPCRCSREPPCQIASAGLGDRPQALVALMGLEAEEAPLDAGVAGVVVAVVAVAFVQEVGPCTHEAACTLIEEHSRMQPGLGSTCFAAEDMACSRAADRMQVVGTSVHARPVLECRPEAYHSEAGARVAKRSTGEAPQSYVQEAGFGKAAAPVVTWVTQSRRSRSLCPSVAADDIRW